MRHARQISERRGGDTGGSAWPSIVATTSSLGGAAAGIASMLLWDDTFHLRLGVGLAAAGALVSTAAVLFLRRDRQTRRELLADAREDHAQELKFEIGRREHRITALKVQVMEAEETVLLFEQRVQAELARAQASDAARVRAEHDLAVLSAWIEQARAAAEITASAVRSFHEVQPFEPAQPLAQVHAQQPRVELAAAGSGQRAAEAAYAADNAYSAGLSHVAQPRPPAYPVDLTPAAAVPVSPIMAAAVEEPRRAGSENGGAARPRPLRPAVLQVREAVGFDVADDVNTAVPVPYVVPGVSLPTQRDTGAVRVIAPTRPIAPERLYRPYLGAHGAPVDLTMYDETQQMRVVEDRRTGTA